MFRFLKSVKLMSLVFTVLLISFEQICYAQNKSENLSDEVIDAISSRYDPSNIEVTIKGDGWVILNGKANLLYDKDRIFDIVSHIDGVKKITDDIMVVPETVPANKYPNILPDNIIKENVSTLIGRNAAIEEPQKIKINVDNSLVFLSGVVHYYREKLLAETAASQVKGVNAIENDIKVIPLNKALTDKDIHDVLVSVFNNEFPLVDRNSINFKVDNGSVIIWGTVTNIWLKENIGKEFSDIEGVTDVINNLKVKPDLNS